MTSANDDETNRSIVIARCETGPQGGSFSCGIYDKQSSWAVVRFARNVGKTTDSKYRAFGERFAFRPSGYC